MTLLHRNVSGQQSGYPVNGEVIGRVDEVYQTEEGLRWTATVTDPDLMRLLLGESDPNVPSEPGAAIPAGDARMVYIVSEGAPYCGCLVAAAFPYYIEDGYTSDLMPSRLLNFGGDLANICGLGSAFGDEALIEVVG